MGHSPAPGPGCALAPEQCPLLCPCALGKHQGCNEIQGQDEIHGLDQLGNEVPTSVAAGINEGLRDRQHVADLMWCVRDDSELPARCGAVRLGAPRQVGGGPWAVCQALVCQGPG